MRLPRLLNYFKQKVYPSCSLDSQNPEKVLDNEEIDELTNNLAITSSTTDSKTDSESSDLELLCDSDNDFSDDPIYLDYIYKSGYIYWVICKHCTKMGQKRFFKLSSKRDLWFSRKVRILLMFVWRTFEKKGKITKSEIKNVISSYFYDELIGDFDSEDYLEVDAQLKEYLEDCQSVSPLFKLEIDSNTLKTISKKIGLKLTIKNLFDEIYFKSNDEIVEILKLIVNEKEKKNK